MRIQIQSGHWIRIRIRNPDPDPGGQIVVFDTKICFLQLSIFSNFIKPWIRIGSGSVFSLKCWIRIRMKWIRIRNIAEINILNKNALPDYFSYFSWQPIVQSIIFSLLDAVFSESSQIIHSGRYGTLPQEPHSHGNKTGK